MIYWYFYKITHVSAIDNFHNLERDWNNDVHFMYALHMCPACSVEAAICISFNELSPVRECTYLTAKNRTSGPVRFGNSCSSTCRSICSQWWCPLNFKKNFKLKIRPFKCKTLQYFEQNSQGIKPRLRQVQNSDALILSSEIKFVHGWGWKFFPLCENFSSKKNFQRMRKKRTGWLEMSVSTTGNWFYIVIYLKPYRHLGAPNIHNIHEKAATKTVHPHGNRLSHVLGRSSHSSLDSIEARQGILYNIIISVMTTKSHLQSRFFKFSLSSKKMREFTKDFLL